MSDQIITQHIEDMRIQVTRSHKLLGNAPVPYRELLTDTFSQLDTTLEELQVAEQELRQQNEVLTETRETVELEQQRYRNLFEFAPAGYLVTDPSGIIMEANGAASVMLNIASKFLNKKPLLSFIPEDQRSKFRQEIWAVGELGHTPEWEFWVQPRHYNSYPVSATVTAEKDKNGNVVTLRWMLRDATERKRSESKLIELNAELERRVASRTEQLEAAYSRERRVAETLQRSLLIETPEHAFEGLAVKTFYEGASQDLLVGGDFFDIFGLNEDKVALVVGDVSGKGLAAASYTAQAKYALRAFLHHYISPAESLSLLNKFLCHTQQDISPDIFVVVSVAVVDKHTGEIAFAMGGAEPAIILRASGVNDVIKMNGLPLGVSPDSTYESFETKLEIGDRIVLVTDGLTEARRGNTFLDHVGLTAIARESLSQPTLTDSGEFIFREARAFTGGVLHDDACLLLAQRVE